MLLFPAIDLKDGKCVRLLRGDMAKATVFNDSPAAQAKTFANAGCEWLHVDYLPELTSFYEACGFRPTAAGLGLTSARRPTCSG